MVITLAVSTMPYQRKPLSIKFHWAPAVIKLDQFDPCLKTSTRKSSAVYNIAPTIRRFCGMWEGQALLFVTIFHDYRVTLYIGWRGILIYGSSWSGLMRTQTVVTYWWIAGKLGVSKCRQFCLDLTCFLPVMEHTVLNNVFNCFKVFKIVTENVVNTAFL